MGNDSLIAPDGLPASFLAVMGLLRDELEALVDPENELTDAVDEQAHINIKRMLRLIKSSLFIKITSTLILPRVRLPKYIKSKTSQSSLDYL